MPSQSPPLADEKALLPNTFDPSTRREDDKAMRRYSSTVIRRIILAIVASLATISLFHTAYERCHYHKPRPQPADINSVETDANKVPLEIHVMSKCPDARDCLRELILPTMVEVSDRVQFTMSFIGSIDPNSDAVSCMHGPSECLGNIILLCAAKTYPDVKLSLGFTNCMISDYPDIPNRDLVEECALEHGLDFSKLNSCISDEGEGIDLLRSSIERSRQNNVTKSCTVRLAGKVRCIRDGGEWYDCPGGSSVQQLVGDINKLYNEGSS